MSNKMKKARTYAAMSKDLLAFGHSDAGREAYLASLCVLSGDEVGERAHFEQCKALVADGFDLVGAA